MLPKPVTAGGASAKTMPSRIFEKALMARPTIACADWSVAVALVEVLERDEGDADILAGAAEAEADDGEDALDSSPSRRLRKWSRHLVEHLLRPVLRRAERQRARW